MSNSKISYSSRVKRTDIKYEHILRSRRGMSMANDANPDKQQDNRLKMELAEIDRQKRLILRKQRLGSGAAIERLQATPSALKRQGFAQARLNKTLAKYGMELPVMNKSPRPNRTQSCDAYSPDTPREALKKCFSVPGRSKRIYSALYDPQSYERFCEKVLPLQEQYRAMRADLDDKISGRRFMKATENVEDKETDSDSECSLPSTPDSSEQESTVTFRASPFLPSPKPRKPAIEKAYATSPKLKPKPSVKKQNKLHNLPPKSASAPLTSARRNYKPATLQVVGSQMPPTSIAINGIPNILTPPTSIALEGTTNVSRPRTSTSVFTPHPPPASYLLYCDDINHYLSESSRLYNNRAVSSEDQVELHNWEAYRSCCPIGSTSFVTGPDISQLSYLSFH